MNKFVLLLCLALSARGQGIYPRAVHITNPGLQVRTSKVGLLSLALSQTFQAYQKGSGANWGVKINPPVPAFPNRFWSITSYDYLANCQGTVQYASVTRQINNKVVVGAINAALSGGPLCSQDDRGGILSTPGSPYVGKFSDTASKLVIVNYDNLDQYPVFPSTEDNYYSGRTVYNAPYVVNNEPLSGLPVERDGEQLQVNWPAEHSIDWGKPDFDAQDFSWSGSRVFIIDPNNPNPVLRCFDITRFFQFEESFSKFCWDTMDRVSDGKIVRNATQAVDAPCAGLGSQTCGVSGSGSTKFFWRIKFNNVAECSNLAPNYELMRYYRVFLGFDPAWGGTFGTSLDDANIQASQNALVFTVSGIGTYSWGYKVLSDGLKWPLGTMSMNVNYGQGYAPLCGVFTGRVSVSEQDKSTKQFGGVWCLDF